MREGSVWLGGILLAFGVITHFIAITDPENDVFLRRVSIAATIFGAGLALLGLVLHDHIRKEEQDEHAPIKFRMEARP